MTLALDGVAVGRGGRTLLADLTARFEHGMIALLGPNGVGKTTLLRTLGGALAPAAGRVTLDGRDVRALEPRERAQRIALVDPSEGVFAALSVAQAVGAARFPHHRWYEWEPTPQDRAAIDGALERTALLTLRERELGTLSAGERQRVWIALALAQAAPVVLLDEPTSHLDLRASVETLRLIRGLTAGGTLAIAVLHSLEEAAAFADRVVLLGDGGIIADGTPAQALTPAAIERAYGVRVAVECRPEGLTFHRA